MHKYFELFAQTHTRYKQNLHETLKLLSVTVNNNNNENWTKFTWKKREKHVKNQLNTTLLLPYVYSIPFMTEKKIKKIDSQI